MKPISAKSGKAGVQIFESHLRSVAGLSTAFHVYNRFNDQTVQSESVVSISQTLNNLGPDETETKDYFIGPAMYMGRLGVAVRNAPNDDSEISIDDFDLSVINEEFLECKIGNAEELSRILISTCAMVETIMWIESGDEPMFHGPKRITKKEAVEPSLNHYQQFITRSLVRELKNQVIISAVSIRTSFFLEILRHLFRVNKSIIPNDVKFDYHEILEIGSWDEFLDYSFTKYVDTKGWRGTLKSQLKFFDLVLSQPIRLDSKYLDICEETEAYRHNLVHGSKVNEKLVDKVSSTELNIGDNLDFTDQELQQIFDANIRLFHQMARSAFSYLGLPGPLLQYVADPNIIDPEEQLDSTVTIT
jgi:hypothetical protein